MSDILIHQNLLLLGDIWDPLKISCLFSDLMLLIFRIIKTLFNKNPSNKRSISTAGCHRKSRKLNY